jgi:hypothetical protein
MSPLAWSLAAIVGLTVGLWWITGLGDPARMERVAGSFFKIYTILVAVVLCVTIWYHIGFARHGTRLLSTAEQTRVSHLGFYVDPESAFRFIGEAGQPGFNHPALYPGESLEIRPDWQRKDWILTYDMGSAPLRVNGRCLNVPDAWWFLPGETLRIELSRPAGTEFVEVRRQEERTWWGSRRYSLLYSQGSIQNGRSIYDPDAQGLVLSRQALREGQALAIMARHAPELRPLAIDEEWWEVLQGVFWVREVRDDTTSRIGVLADRETLATPGLRFLKDAQLLEPPSGQGSQRVRPEDIVFYGLGPDGALDLRLTSKTVPDPVWGEVLEIHLGRKASWPLPPAPGTQFLLTSSSEHIPLDGYHIGLGGTSRPFYAKAALSPDLDRVDVIHGRGLRTWALGETIRLGGVNEGFLLAVERLEARVPWTGLLAAVFVAVNALLFCLFSWWRGRKNPGLDLAWTLLWNLSLVLLVVRLLLAYRVSLLPPENATPREVDLFHLALTVSLWALAAGPLVLLAVRVLSGLELGTGTGRQPRTRSRLLLWGLAAAGLLWIVLAKLFGNNESFFGLRVNLTAHLILVLFLALGAGTFIGYRLGRWIVAVYVFAMVLALILAGDSGFVIYGMSLGVAVLFLLLWDRPARISWLVGPAILVLGMLVLPYVPTLPSAQKLIDPALPDTVRYRLVSFTDSQDSLLLGPGESEVNVDKLLRNSHQAWQMRLYAATGAAKAQGFARMPLSDRGMTYPTSLADCVFAVYLVSEHGSAAGFFLIAVYVLLGLACLWAVGFLPSTHQHRIIPLAAVAAYFICNALYMASANVGLTVFTGQNLPLLALYSKLDALHGTLLLAFATLLLRVNVSGTVLRRDFEFRPVHLALRTFTVLVVAWLFVLGVWTYGLGAKDVLRNDFDFSSAFFKEIEEHAEGVNEPDRHNSPWSLVDHELRRKPFGSVTAAEEVFAEQLNQRPNKFDQRGGLFYLETERDREGREKVLLRVNRHFFRLRSPLRRETLWSGRLLARYEPQHPTISGLGRPFRIMMSDTGHAQSLALSAPPPMRVNRQILFKEEVHDTSFEFLEIFREGPNVFLISKRGSWDVYVEGQKVTPGVRVRLQEFNLIGIAKGDAYQRDFIYLGAQPTVLAYVQWRNGAQRRFFPEGENFPMAYALGRAMDRNQALGAAVPQALALSIDIELQRALQSVVSVFAQRHGGLYRNDPLRSRAVAVTVLDPVTGEVLALPSWPAPDPNDPGFEDLLEQASTSQLNRVITNPNLRRHAIGSTFKPLLFAGLATQLDPAFDLERLVVNQRPQLQQTQLAGLPIDSWDNKDPAGRIGAADYLVHSRNPFQLTIGMLGTLLTLEDLERVLVPAAAAPELEYEGRGFNLDLKRVSESPFSLEDPLPRPRTEAMTRTLAFRGLAELYGVGLHGKPEEERLQECRALLPGLACDERLVKLNEYLDNVLAEPVDFRPGDFQWIRQNLIPFFLGAEECRWNNVKLAEAWSRVLTGHRVRAILEDHAGGAILHGQPAASPWQPMPAPVGNADWRRDHLLVPLRQVGILGTASDLADLAPWPQTAFYKTGTIDEGTPGYESELLLFALGESRDGSLDLSQGLTGVLYLQDSKTLEDRPSKFNLGRCVVQVLRQRLAEPLSSGLEAPRECLEIAAGQPSSP